MSNSTTETETSHAKIDMLHGSIWNKLPRYALPVAATAILEQLFNASDIAVVGNFSAGDKTVAVAAVGANSPIIGLILNLFIGIALGANVVIANAIGRKDMESVHKAVHTSIVMAVLGGIIVTLLGELIAGKLMGILNIPDEVYPYALQYLRIYLLGMPVIFLYNFEAAIFRSIGDTKVPLQALLISGVLNVIMNFFFVMVLHMAVNGVAIATVLSNVVSSLLLLYKLIRTDKCVRVELRQLKMHRHSLIRIIQIGLPAGIQSAVFAVANIVIQTAINSLGTVVIAASSAAFNIEILAYDVLNSFSQACTTFVGQNYGAKKMDRVQKGYRISFWTVAIWGALIMLAFIIFPGPIAGVFFHEEKAMEIAISYLIIIGFSEAFMCVELMTIGALSGLGKTKLCSVISITATSMRIPLAMVLSRTSLGLDGIWWALTLTSVAKGIIFYLTFRYQMREKC